MTTCDRCGEDRWPSTPTEPYTCQRCREALAGKNAMDPLGTPAQQVARQAASRRMLKTPLYRRQNARERHA